MFYVLTNCTCFDHEAEPVSAHATKAEADSACPPIPGYWVEEFAPNLDYVDVNGIAVYVQQ